MARADTPYECGPGRFCELSAAKECTGYDASVRAREVGAKRQIRRIRIAGEGYGLGDGRRDVEIGGRKCDVDSSAVRSPDFRKIVALGMVSSEVWNEGNRIEAISPRRQRNAVVRERSFD
ncbi:MAG: hypothetical protein OXI87_04485 [Albidovulum sp.]|nr:hypothetical protein [Albidovulum sp.]MDE0533447.1 hypothetical protein [Albidovulum sp.]